MKKLFLVLILILPLGFASCDDEDPTEGLTIQDPPKEKLPETQADFE